jgi:hypothetical protein
VAEVELVYKKERYMYDFTPDGMHKHEPFWH